MKSLIAGIVLIVVVGFAGFLYRNVAEQGGGPEPVACTMDAKLCPDGSGVGRTGPSCEFAPCPFPNVELPDANLSFVAPEGYERIALPGDTDPTVLLGLGKPSASAAASHSIVVRRYAIGQGETADDAILSRTRYQPADMEAEDFSKFTTSLINGKEVRSTVVERFEGLVHSAYFIARANDILMLEIVEHDVADWTDPALVVEELPEHKAFLGMLSTVSVGQ